MHTTSSVRSSAPAARLLGAVKRFGDVTALGGVDLDLRQGEVTALLGPNGAGKTTAVRSLLGLGRLDEGAAELFGGEPLDLARRRRVGAMMQVSSVPATLKVREHLELFAAYYPRPLAITEAVRAAGLAGLEDRLFGKLSGGQQQRLLFALAICGDPDLLFLDEPTVGLDVASRRGFWEHIRGLASRGRTVLLTTHYLEEADALADRVVVIDRGRIVADGTPAEVKARAASRRIRCRTGLKATEVAALPGVERVRRDGTSLEVFTTTAEPVLRELLARDPQLAELEVAGAGLEDAFLSLTTGAGDAACLEKGAA